METLLLLIQNVDVFVWSSYEVPGVDPEFIVHRLNVDPSFPPKKQKPRRSAKEHIEVVRLEVQKLKEAGAIKEIHFLEWLANTIVVKKKNGKWRVCVDCTNLNRACPKDLYPMPKIDQLVDSTYGHPKMSFFDAFQGYHQIVLALEDREKTAFISLDANYHYTVMPFGLKNAGATYQWMMTRMFRDKIRRTVEVYIDNMVVKSKQEVRHIEDLQGVFEVLRQHKLHLNADKCAFGVEAGKFLGYLITGRGIEVNPNQIEAVKHLKPPSNPKKVQVLTGMLVDLNRFISKFADHYRPFYQLLRKWKGFQWDEECEKAFQDSKGYLTQAPMLTTLNPGRTYSCTCNFRSRCKHRALERSRSAASCILYQQNPGRRQDEILTSEKVGIGFSSCHQKVAPLLPGSYRIRVDQVSFTVVVKEVRLYGADS